MQVKDIKIKYFQNTTGITLSWESGDFSCQGYEKRLTATQVALEILKMEQDYLDKEYFKLSNECPEPDTSTIMQEEK